MSERERERSWRGGVEEVCLGGRGGCPPVEMGRPRAHCRQVRKGGASIERADGRVRKQNGMANAVLNASEV